MTVSFFDVLVKQKRAARTGFNPQTRQKVKVTAKTVVKFRVAKGAKDAILGAKTPSDAGPQKPKPSTMDFIRFEEAAPVAMENPNVDRVARRKAVKARHEAKGNAPVTEGDDNIPMD